MTLTATNAVQMLPKIHRDTGSGDLERLLRAMKEGDFLPDTITATAAELNILDGATATAAELNAIADVSARVQELTATGAVTSGVQMVELNHVSTVIAATIADSANHAGTLFTVRNTSASGTAAHTLTLTSGTFDGTNNVATLNAPGESLSVVFDSAGNGIVILNTGTVGLGT